MMPLGRASHHDANVIDWTHPAHDRRRPVAQAQGAWLIDATHLCLIAILPGFALVLLDPDVFAKLGNFRVFASVATAPHWAAGLTAVAALAVWGWASRRWALRCTALFALGTAHWVLALGFLLAPPHGTAVSTYSILAVLAWCYAWDAYRAR